MDLIISNYLKTQHMYYTLSVFSSESLYARSAGDSNNIEACRNAFSTLGLNTIRNFTAGEPDCMLHAIIDELANIQEKLSLQATCSNISKLAFNKQSQTESEKLTTGSQASRGSDAGTQTHCSEDPEIKPLKEELHILRRKLEQSQTDLNARYQENQEYQRKISHLLEVNRKSLQDLRPAILSAIATERLPQSSSDPADNIDDERIQEAQRFLHTINNRINSINRRFEDLQKDKEITFHQLNSVPVTLAE